MKNISERALEVYEKETAKITEQTKKDQEEAWAFSMDKLAREFNNAEYPEVDFDVKLSHTINRTHFFLAKADDLALMIKAQPAASTKWSISLHPHHKCPNCEEKFWDVDTGAKQIYSLKTLGAWLKHINSKEYPHIDTDLFCKKCRNKSSTQDDPWIQVSKESSNYVSRMRVPGGFLIRTEHWDEGSGTTTAVAMTFVPSDSQEWTQ